MNKTDLTGVGWTFKTYNRIAHIKYVESKVERIDLTDVIKRK